MSTSPPPIVRAFMTHEMRDDDIAALATGRREEFERILDAIQRSRRAAPGTLQHVVLYGSRGFGKSFMTRRVQIATTDMGGQKGPVHYVLLAEEQHNLQRNPHAFLDLLAEHLKQARGDAGDADAAFRATMFQWPKPGEEGRRWDEAAARLETEIDATLGRGRGLVIAVVENFDALLATLFKDGEDEQRLRQWLDRANNRLMLFATATGTVDIHYDRPLFQAFESIRLSPWTPDDCVDYFNRLRRLERRSPLSVDEEAKARAIAEFIGGTPRLAQLLAEVIDTQEALTVADTMSALADRLAEYYRRRIDDLPQLARGLLDALIRGGEPASQTALAERVGAGGQNIIARTMADLERADIIRGRRAPDSREKLYGVTDRVFVHYYRLRQGSVVARHTPLATILDFLRSFYSRDEQLLQALKHLEAGRPAEAGLFSRLATEGMKRPANEYLSAFSKRLELYVDGLVDAERAPILELARRLKDEPEESYHQCDLTDQSRSLVMALCSAIKAQALERMNLTGPAREALDRISETTDKDAAAVMNCERHLFFRDVTQDCDASSGRMSELPVILGIPSVGIRLAAAVLAAAELRKSRRFEDVIALVQPMAIEALSAGKQTVEMHLLSELVMSLTEEDRHAEALEASERVSRLAEEIGSPVACAASLAQTAMLHGQLGHGEEAAELAQRAVNFMKTLENPGLEAYVQGALAWVLRGIGQEAQAEESYAHSSNAARQAGDPKMQAEMLQQRAEVLIELERFDQAVEIALEAANLLDDTSSDDERLAAFSTVARALSRTDQHEEALSAAKKSLKLAERLGRPRDEVSALVRVAAAHVELNSLDAAWARLEEALILLRNLDTPGFLAQVLMISAVVGAPLAKPSAMCNFVEAIEILRSGVTSRADSISLNPIFVGAALTEDFATLDAVLAEHGDWLIENSSTLLFYQQDGLGIGRLAQAKGRAAGYTAIAGLLPRIADFMAKLPSEKRDPTWLPDLISGFAEACHDPGLLRDVGELLSNTLAPQAEPIKALLHALADVDECPDPEMALARLDPDAATLIRRLRSLPESESKPKRKKRKKS
jgi:tetratricopeptide (TPR) repeat protein